jgi:hypothetical protein
MKNMSKNQKQRKLGERLLIATSKHPTTGKPGDFQAVDGFFLNKHDAFRYYERHYLGKPYRIQGYRVNITPVSYSERRRDDENQGMSSKRRAASSVQGIEAAKAFVKAVAEGGGGKAA